MHEADSLVKDPQEVSISERSFCEYMPWPKYMSAEIWWASPEEKAQVPTVFPWDDDSDDDNAMMLVQVIMMWK